MWLGQRVKGMHIVVWGIQICKRPTGRSERRWEGDIKYILWNWVVRKGCGWNCLRILLAVGFGIN
jgi:hypothetical protein